MSCNSPLFRKINGEYVAVPCGYCYACKIDKRNMWSDRLLHDSSHAMKQGFGSTFLTLTYDDLHYPFNGSLSVDDAQKFIKRLRRECEYHKIKLPVYASAGKPTFHYYLVGEYGGKIGRPHYHAIVCGLDDETMKPLARLCWKSGFNLCKPLMAGGIRYVLKYIDKQCSPEMEEKIYTSAGLHPPFSICSRGIGKDYLIENKEFLSEYGAYRYKSSMRPLPYYYRKLLGYKTGDSPLKKVLCPAVREALASGSGALELYNARKALNLELQYVHALQSDNTPANLDGVKYLQKVVSYLEKKANKDGMK